MGKRITEFSKISKCVLLSLIVTVILCGIFALAVYLWQIEESTARIVVFAFMIVSVLFGAFVLAKNLEHSGLLNGLIMAFGYFLVISILSFAAGKGISLGVRDITRFVTITAAGMLGGVLGINT
ncbi:MAG: TIGR04086 family membrane protein [Firmicutes bacterium]|nr:TIGR04086 family membrane protein [Bacillota bacterium]